MSLAPGAAESSPGAEGADEQNRLALATLHLDRLGRDFLVGDLVLGLTGGTVEVHLDSVAGACARGWEGSEHSLRWGSEEIPTHLGRRLKEVH